jgi:hypothetical protein
MKTFFIITGFSVMCSIFAAPRDRAETECMREAAKSGQVELRKCRAMKDAAKRQDCETKTNASLAGAEKACKTPRK